MRKLFLDYDGIFTTHTILGLDGLTTGKLYDGPMKAYIKILSLNYDIYVITGSRSPESLDVTINSLKDLPITDFISVKPGTKYKYILDNFTEDYLNENIIYCGEDPSDIDFELDDRIAFYTSSDVIGNISNSNSYLDKTRFLENLTNVLCELNGTSVKRIINHHESIFIAQAYSSRSYTTGKYDMFTDGNLAFTLDTILQCPILKKFTITYPNNSNFKEHEEFFQKHFPNVTWQPVEYKENVAKTRESGIQAKPKANDTLFISFFPTLSLPNVENILIANVSPVKELPRRSLDEYFESVPRSSIGKFDTIFIFNRNQAEYFLNDGYEPVLVDKIYYGAYTKIKLSELEEVIEELGKHKASTKPGIFFPFRLTDPDYRFNNLVNDGDTNIYITDPNESYQYNYNNVYNVKDHCPRHLHRGLYYYFLLHHDNKIVISANSSHVAHIGLCEIEALCPEKIIYLCEEDDIIYNKRGGNC